MKTLLKTRSGARVGSKRSQAVAFATALALMARLASGAGLITDGDFEQATRIGNNNPPPGWRTIVNSFGAYTIAHRGTYGMHVGGASQNGGEYQDITTVPGAEYELSFWVVGWTSGVNPQTGIVQVGTPGSNDHDLALNNNAEYVNQTLDQIPLFTSPDSWTFHSFRFVAQTELTRVSFQNVGPSAINVDDVSVMAVGVFAITGQPASQSAFCGDNVTFTVEVQNANNPTYQWYRGTDPLADAVSPELTLTDVQTADSGSTFFAVVTSSSVSLTSAVATLTVTCSGLIYNGGFEVRGQTGSQNNALPLGWTEIVNSYGCWGAQPPAQPPHGGSLVMHVGSNSRPGGEYQDIVTVPGQRYQLTFWAVGWISGVSPQTGLVQVGTPGSIATDLSLNNNAEYVNAPIQVPVFTSAADWTLFTFLFTAATELTRVSFQNGAPSAISLDDVSVFPVTADWGINTQPLSQGTLCSSNVTFTVGTDSIWPVGYQWYFSGAELPGANGATLALNNVTTTNAGEYFAVVNDGFQMATSAVARLTVSCSGGLIVNGSFEVRGQPGSQNNSLPMGWAEILNSYGCWGAQPPIQPPHSGQLVMHVGANGNNGGEYQDIVTEPGQQYALSFWAVGWLTGTDVQSGLIQVGTPGSVDTDLSLNNNADYVNATVNLPRFDGAASWTPFLFLFTAATETTRVTFQNLAPSSINLDDVTVFPAAALLITNQPASQLALCGGSVMFGVGAQGTPPLTYQWYFGTNAITGATTDTLALTGVQVPDSGGYSVVVSNNSGSVTSIVATLAVSCFGMMDNGGFEMAGPNGSQNNPIPARWNEIANSYGRWAASPPTRPAHGGNYVMHVGAAGGNGGEYQDLATVPGQEYVLNFWAVGWLDGAGTQSGLVQVGTAGSNPNDLALNNNAEYVNVSFGVPKFDSAASWTHFSYPFTAATESTRVSFQNVAPGAINVDDVSLDLASRLTIAPAAPGNLTLRWSGTPGRLYLLQAAEAISGPWITVTSLVAPGDGVMEYVVTPKPTAFYRTVAP